jgi:hypothetical protein
MMFSRSLSFLVIPVLIFSTTGFAQPPQSAAPKVSNWGGQADGPFPKLPPPDPNASYNLRDFSGAWETDHRGTGGYRGMTDEAGIPPRTPWAEAVFRSRVTGRTTKEKEGVPPALGNDPIMACNPYGIPRLLFFTNPVEFFHTPDRVLMFFEWQRAVREIWMDGRELPKDPDPRWMGYSVGRWEGDTLVIDTVGFDDRAWLDQYGNVYSSGMRFQERWKRTGRDTLEAVYRIDDPKSYARPWVSTTKIFRRQAGEIREEFCAPMDEGYFNQNVRDPAGGVIKK